MNESVFELVEKSCETLKLDFSSAEFATLAEENDLSEDAVAAIGLVFDRLRQKKIQTTIHTILKMSRLPLKDPKTFDNFDFSVIKGRDAERLKSLSSLSAIYAHKNIAFIGPAGTGKTHLAQAFGFECCKRGMKTYFIKMSELRDRFTAARRAGKEAAALTGLVRPSCLIIDEVGHCEFDKENTRLFFDLIDRRYNKEGNFNEDDALLCSLDRIFDDATVFNIKGESFRGKKLETIALQTSRVKTQDSSVVPTP